MPGTQTTAIPIRVFRVEGSSDALPQTYRLAQAATQTFNLGTPVAVVTGFVQASGAIAATTNQIAGFSDQFGDNLVTAGVAPVGGSGVKYGSVQNQPAAVNIPIGAPLADGAAGVLVANNLTIFYGKTDAAHALAQTDIGAIYGLTKDATTGNWFVDTTIITAATGACCLITNLLDPIGTVGGRVAFKITQPFQQINQ